MKTNSTLILLGTIAIAIGSGLQYISEPVWVSIIGNILLAVGGLLGGTGGNSKYQKYQKEKMIQR